MDFTSKHTFESTRFPGVRFTLRRMTAGNRVLLNLALAPVTAKLSEMGKRLHAIQALLPDVPVEIEERTEADWQLLATHGETLDRFYSVMESINGVLANERAPILFRWGLLKIEGITIDGKIPTPDEVFDGAPEELVYEIIAKINEAAGLSVEESKNSELPSTSGALEGSTTPSATSAMSAYGLEHT